MAEILPHDLPESLKNLGKLVLEELLEASSIVEIPNQTEILRVGQYVKVIPIVLEGLLKVCTQYEERDLLLYYIRPSESCVMSFAYGMNQQASVVFARTEADSKLLLIPIEKAVKLGLSDPQMSALFFRQYNQRYSELLDTIHHLIHDKLDKRLEAFLVERSELTGKNPLEISHRQIATELGTAREVISRVIKKLENEGRVRQESGKIYLP
jgi:CRP/FNR family transcriptional regulator